MNFWVPYFQLSRSQDAGTKMQSGLFDGGLGCKKWETYGKMGKLPGTIGNVLRLRRKEHGGTSCKEDDPRSQGWFMNLRRFSLQICPLDRSNMSKHIGPIPWPRRAASNHHHHHHHHHRSSSSSVITYWCLVGNEGMGWLLIFINHSHIPY